MEHLKDLEALLRNTNVQSPRSSDTTRSSKRSSLTPVLSAINLSDFISHFSFPKRPSSSSFDAAQILLLLEIITGVIWFEDPPLGLPTSYVNICLRVQRWAKEKAITLAWTEWQRNRGQLQVGQEVDRNPCGQSGIEEELMNNDSSWSFCCHLHSRAWINDQQAAYR